MNADQVRFICVDPRLSAVRSLRRFEMARTKFIAGNWKMNTTKAQAVDLARGIARGVPTSGVQVGVAPPFVYIDAVVQAARGSNLLVGAQDCYFEKFGAF